MRKTLFLLFALALAYPAAAHADTITFSVSVVASGFAGDTLALNAALPISGRLADRRSGRLG